LNFGARKHPVNMLRRDALLAKLVADYHPTTTMQHATCEHLAGTLEQLEVLKPGSSEHQRLVQLAQQLGAALEESRPRSASISDLSELSLDALSERLDSVKQTIEQLRSVEITTPPVIDDGDAGQHVTSTADSHEPAASTVAPAPRQTSPTAPQPPAPPSRTTFVPSEQQRRDDAAKQYWREHGEHQSLKPERR
jgi:hypothetical protein